MYSAPYRAPFSWGGTVGRVRSRACRFLENAAIHYDENSCGAGALRGCFVYYALLQPHGPGANGDGFVHDLGNDSERRKTSTMSTFSGMSSSRA